MQLVKLDLLNYCCFLTFRIEVIIFKNGVVTCRWFNCQIEYDILSDYTLEHYHIQEEARTHLKTLGIWLSRKISYPVNQVGFLMK